MTLALRGVSKRFGGLAAVSNVSFEVPERSIFGLIGPNGAGKTTVFNLVTGVYRCDAGDVRFGDADVGRMKPAQIAARGVARTFQNIRLFAELTVLENLLAAGEIGRRAGRDDEQATRDRAMELLRAFKLETFVAAMPTSLPYGTQRRLEIARALMTSPKILLLDEPAAGMSSREADELKDRIVWLRDDRGLTILLVEHNMQLVMSACERVHVLDHGETIAEGTASEVRANPRVIAAYLGEPVGESDACA